MCWAGSRACSSAHWSPIQGNLHQRNRFHRCKNVQRGELETLRWSLCAFCSAEWSILWDQKLLCWAWKIKIKNTKKYTFWTFPLSDLAPSLIQKCCSSLIQQEPTGTEFTNKTTWSKFLIVTIHRKLAADNATPLGFTLQWVSSNYLFITLSSVWLISLLYNIDAHSMLVTWT